jgi:hypothetical protein
LEGAVEYDEFYARFGGSARTKNIAQTPPPDAPTGAHAHNLRAFSLPEHSGLPRRWRQGRPDRRRFAKAEISADRRRGRAVRRQRPQLRRLHERHDELVWQPGRQRTADPARFLSRPLGVQDAVADFMDMHLELQVIQSPFVGRY